VTFDEAWERLDKGERFEDPEILKLINASGCTIAHSQAWRGWTTLDPDILSLGYKYGCRETVLDIMLKRGWEPQTEEEKLIVFTVKASK